MHEKEDLRAGYVENGLKKSGKHLVLRESDFTVAETDDVVESEHLGRPCIYGKKRDANGRRLDGKSANIAYSRDKIRKK
jgi:hypothetical protein